MYQISLRGLGIFQLCFHLYQHVKQYYWGLKYQYRLILRYTKNKTKQNKTKNKTKKQNKTKQNKTKNKTKTKKQNKTKQTNKKTS